LSRGEPVGGAYQNPADAVERIIGAATMAGQIALDAAADLVDTGVGQPDQVEVIGDQPDVAQPPAIAGDGGLVAGVRIDRDLADGRDPGSVTLIEPGLHGRGGTTRHDIEQPASADVDHAGDVHAATVTGRCEKRGLVQPERGDTIESGGVIDQRLADVDDGAHRGLPTHPEGAGNGRDRGAFLPDLPAHLGTGAFGQHRARCDRGVPFGPRARRTQLLMTTPQPLAPPQPGRATRDR
jgi:hypothetical protein